jgi:Big-like domain-containing protein
MPVDLATVVAVNGNITATFSEAMDAATITTATLTLTQGATLVPSRSIRPRTSRE